MLHPFREGNGRTLRTFISLVAMESGGLVVEWNRMNPRENIEACAHAAFHDESKLEVMLNTIIDFS